MNTLLSRRSFVRLAACALAAVGLRSLPAWKPRLGGRLRLQSARRAALPGRVWLVAEEPNTSWLLLAAALGWQTRQPLSTDQGVPIHVVHSGPGQRSRHVVVGARSLARSAEALVVVLFEQEVASVETWPAGIASRADLLVAIGSPQFNPFDDADAIPDKFWVPVTVKRPGPTRATHRLIERPTRNAGAITDWMDSLGL